MLTRPSVMITVIVCSTLFGLGVICAIMFLVYTGHDTAAISAVLSGPFVTYLMIMNSRVKSMHDSLKALQDGGADNGR